MKGAKCGGFYKDMCNGPNPERASRHQEDAKFHEMMAKFYRLDREDQLVFMAAFEQMVDNDDRRRRVK